MKYHTLFFRKLGKMSQTSSSAGVVIGALMVNYLVSQIFCVHFKIYLLGCVLIFYKSFVKLFFVKTKVLALYFEETP